MIFVTGDGGQLANELVKLFNNKSIEYKSFSITQWNICEVAQGRELILKHKPNVVINCAAYTNVEKAEVDKEASSMVNEFAVKVLAELAVEFDFHLIHISTDFVFGEPSSPIRPWQIDDVAHPLNQYGRSKRAGEIALEKIFAVNSTSNPSGRCSLVRTSWLYSATGINFVKTMLSIFNDPQKSQNIHVIEDQLGRATSAFRLAEFLLLLSDDKNLTSINKYHFSNEGICSWYNLAQETLKISLELGYIRDYKVTIKAISASAYGSKVVRSSYGVLELSSARKVMPKIATWQDDLRATLKSLKLLKSTEKKGE